MYFISRNNSIYDFIAHTRVKNRYVCTGFFVVTILFGAYFLHCLVTTYKDIYLQEVALLQKMYRESQHLEKKNKDLIVMIDSTKNGMMSQVQHEKSHDFIKKQVQFVLEALHNAELKLNSYGVQKEKNKNWYKKERAHFDVSGNLKQILDFFEKIQNSQKMITINQWSMTRIDENMLRLECDMEFVVVMSI